MRENHACSSADELSSNELNDSDRCCSVSATPGLRSKPSRTSIARPLTDTLLRASSSVCRPYSLTAIAPASAAIALSFTTVPERSSTCSALAEFLASASPSFCTPEILPRLLSVNLVRCTLVCIVFANNVNELDRMMPFMLIE